jgi:hypothetical protein
MPTYRNELVQKNKYSVGATPPKVEWTFVKGDTAAFRVYVTDDNLQPLTIADWSIRMKIKRPNTNPVIPGEITDTATTIMLLTPTATVDDGPGEFTVSLTSAETHSLQTNDIFDIQLSLPQDDIVWTVAQGRVIVLEDVTD